MWDKIPGPKTGVLRHDGSGYCHGCEREFIREWGGTDLPENAEAMGIRQLRIAFGKIRWSSRQITEADLHGPCRAGTTTDARIPPKKPAEACCQPVRWSNQELHAGRSRNRQHHLVFGIPVDRNRFKLPCRVRALVDKEVRY